MADNADFGGLWAKFAAGDVLARDRLLAAYYREFRQIAHRVMSGEQGRLQVQPTDLAHEAAIRILGSRDLSVRDQAHFLALAAQVMRRTLIDEVRRHKAAKRGGNVVTLWDDCVADVALPSSFDIEDFDRSLERLATIEPEGARIVELRFYAGLTLEEIAPALDLSLSTVHRRWRSARAWLFKEMQVAA